MKFPNVSALSDFFDQYSELQILLTLVENDPADYWLVGGCLRNFILNLPQTDIDIASSSDPTLLAKRWAAKTGGNWFWLDEQRHQSRVVIPDRLILDFNPLRAESIEKDQLLRDFTINSLALLLDESFPESLLLDPLNGVDHLEKKRLKSCSDESFSDDPLRILKGVRHAVTLDLEFENDTWKQLCSTSPLLSRIAGERIRDELKKILASKNVAKGLQLLDESGVLQVILGHPGSQWNSEHLASELTLLNNKLTQFSDFNLPGLESVEQFNAREMILFTELLKEYAPENRSDILHNRLRLSRQLERVVNALSRPSDSALLQSLAVASEPRQQALLVELLNPFAALKLLYWGVCRDKFDLERLKKLIGSFNTLKFHGRIPDLLNGKQVSAALQNVSPRQIGVYQSRIKLAEINGEIFSATDAEKWLKTKLSFDNEEA